MIIGFIKYLKKILINPILINCFYNYLQLQFF